MPKKIAGADLKVGDVIEMFHGKRETITEIEQYHGAFENDPDFHGCRIAKFADLQTGLTVFADDDFEVFNR